MGYIKKVKYLEISLQHEEDVRKAIVYNRENNYEYVIVDDNDLINYSNLALLLRFGYILNIYADRVELRYKNYNKDIEKVETEEV